MTTVAIDGIVFSLQRHGGISVYFRELLDRLRRDAVPTLLTLEQPLQQAAPEGGVALALEVRTARLLERYRRWRAPDRRSAVLHSTYYRRPARTGMPTLVTVHDFTYERCIAGPRRWLHSSQKFAAIRAAQCVVCVSQSTLDDLHELVGLRSGQVAQVIHNGVSEVFRPLSGGVMPERPILLFVGQRAGYKNFALALQALALLPEFELHCVGGGALSPAELAVVPEAVRQRVRHRGAVADEMLNDLYNAAACLVYPSRYEGFGIPVIEAMRAGCPVVAIECKAVREVGGDALLVAADDAAALAEAVRSLTGAAERTERIRRGFERAASFSWENCYQRTRQAYEALAAGPSPRTA